MKITPQDKTSTVQPIINVNPGKTYPANSSMPTALETMIYQMRVFDNWIENHNEEYSRRPVNTGFWGFNSFGKGGSKNVHMYSPHTSAWQDGTPGESFTPYGQTQIKFTYSNKITQTYDLLDKINNNISGATDFIEKTGLSDLNNPDNDKMTNTNSDTVYERVKETFSSSHYVRGVIFRNGKPTDTVNYAPLNKLNKKL